MSAHQSVSRIVATYGDHLASSNSNTCISGSNLAKYSWGAACGFKATGSGSEYVEFRLNLNATGFADLYAVAEFGNLAGTGTTQAVSESFSNEPFSINVRNTVTLSFSVPRGVVVSVDGVSQGIAYVSMYVTPGNHLIVVPSLVNTLTGTRLRFDHWSDESLDATRTVDLEADESLTAIYVTQYYVTATPDAVTFRSGWYDNGTTIRFSLNPSSTNQVMVQLCAFNGWYNNGTLVTKSASGSLMVNESI
jgi:hypothetical protein